MKGQLLLILAVTSIGLPLHATESQLSQEKPSPKIIDRIMSMINPHPYCHKPAIKPLADIKMMLQREAPTLSIDVINKALTILKCAADKNLYHNDILTIIDYSLPAGQKRLWIFDLRQEKLLFHTYVSHGIKSGTISTRYFSNKYDSKSSSIGVYKTNAPYYGRDGLSLRLSGLESGFNDNASNRAIVMHGGWYVEEDFIKKYGRAGRSWGCPAVPHNLTTPIINTIKNNSLMVVYYPSDRWFAKSKFLTCETFSHISPVETRETDIALMMDKKEVRYDVFYADINRIHKNDETKPIAVMAVSHYKDVFQTKIPLARMLRRQINNDEYVALSNTEFETIIADKDKMTSSGLRAFNYIQFVIPQIKMVRGYYLTEMTFVNLGNISNISSSSNVSEKAKSYAVSFDNKSSIMIRPTNQFIRWIGL